MHDCCTYRVAQSSLMSSARYIIGGADVLHTDDSAALAAGPRTIFQPISRFIFSHIDRKPCYISIFYFSRISLLEAILDIFAHAQNTTVHVHVNLYRVLSSRVRLGVVRIRHDPWQSWQKVSNQMLSARKQTIIPVFKE